METHGYNHPGANPNQNFSNPNYRSEKKLAAGLLGILVGIVGANKFFLGYTKEGIIQLVLNLVTCGAASIIPLIEGIIYLTMSDEQFDRTYVHNRKEWF